MQMVWKVHLQYFLRKAGRNKWSEVEEEEEEEEEKTGQEQQISKHMLGNLINVTVDENQKRKTVENHRLCTIFDAFRVI